jgi:hypothetical protein
VPSLYFSRDFVAVSDTGPVEEVAVPGARGLPRFFTSKNGGLVLKRKMWNPPGVDNGRETVVLFCSGCFRFLVDPKNPTEEKGE